MDGNIASVWAQAGDGGSDHRMMTAPPTPLAHRLLLYRLERLEETAPVGEFLLELPMRPTDAVRNVALIALLDQRIKGVHHVRPRIPLPYHRVKLPVEVRTLIAANCRCHCSTCTSSYLCPLRSHRTGEQSRPASTSANGANALRDCATVAALQNYALRLSAGAMRSHSANVGTFFYHSHYDDLMQVPGGLYGAFIVDPRPGTPEAKAAPDYDHEYLQMISELNGYYVNNGKSFPDIQPMTVTQGQTILVRVINIGELIHPMHLHGHYFNVVAEDGASLATPMREDTLTTAPGESYDFTFYAWAAPGSVYPFHCHILAHVMNPGQSMDEMGGLITLVNYTN